jgi:hypothetical protein
VLRTLLTAVVLLTALLGMQGRAEAHAGCHMHKPDRAAAPPERVAQTPHQHHDTHQTPHVPHDEPDGCRHDCTGCSTATPILAALALPVLLPEPSRTEALPLVIERLPGGPPPTAPFQVPRV